MSARPLITVILPVRNEGAFIEACLAAVFAQSYGAENLQVLLVDGRSDDDTRERAARLAAGGAQVEEFRIIDNPGKTAPCALNLGLAAARGEYIARVDGHCEIDRDYLLRGVEYLERTGAAGIAGRLETIGGGHEVDATAEAIAAAMSSAFGVGGSAFRLPGASGEPIEADTIAFPIYTRAATAAAGAFDEELLRNQDDEYNLRLRKLGFKLLLAADMPARYVSRSSFSKLAKQYFQYGVYKVRVLQKHPRQMSLRHFVPATFVASLLAAGAALPLSPWPLVALAGSYFLANLGATILTAAGHGWWQSLSGWARACRLPTAFALVHLGYGLGFLVGLGRFAGRWWR